MQLPSRASSSQLPLLVRQRIAYSGKNFFLHEGVRQVVASTVATCCAPGFHLIGILGPAGSGKSHTAVRIFDELVEQGKHPRLIDADEIEAGLISAVARSSEAGIYLIDDMHCYLAKQRPGSSGPLVTTIEKLRTLGGTLVLFLDCASHRYLFDHHIASRLSAAIMSTISEPAEHEIEPLVAALSRQRGINLNAQQIRFLVRRMPRSIAGMRSYFDRLSHASISLGSAPRWDLIEDCLDAAGA